jgi:hypothetical protein
MIFTQQNLQVCVHLLFQVYFSVTATTLYMTLEGEHWGNDPDEMPAAAIVPGAETSRILATIAPTSVTKGRVKSFLEPHGISQGISFLINLANLKRLITLACVSQKSLEMSLGRVN